MEELFDDKHIVWWTNYFIDDVKWYKNYYEVSFDEAVNEVYNYYKEIKNKVNSEINRQGARTLKEQIKAVMDALYEEVNIDNTEIVTWEPWNPLYTYIVKRTRSWWLMSLETLGYALAEVDTKIWTARWTISDWAPHAWVFFYEWNDDFDWADWYNDAPWTTTTYIMDFPNSNPPSNYIIKETREDYTEGLSANDDWQWTRF